LFYKKTFLAVICACLGLAGGADGSAAMAKKVESLTPHKALYDIDLVATRSGSQIINISGKMFYEWRPSCEAWVTDHRFNLFYEYADSPGMQVSSDFSTYELFDGSRFSFSSRRSRDGELYQELRGYADMDQNGGEAIFTKPEGLTYELGSGTLFPMAHTLEMINRAKKGDRFYSAVVFDGSDEEGPIEINTFIGEKEKISKDLKEMEEIDQRLLNTNAWNIRMAVFPVKNPEESADYEMSLVFHENGVISDMLIEYDDFSVTQKLIALEQLEGEKCP